MFNRKMEYETLIRTLMQIHRTPQELRTMEEWSILGWYDQEYTELLGVLSGRIQRETRENWRKISGREKIIKG